MHVNMRVDLMFKNIEAIWVAIRQGDTKYSPTTEYHEKIVDMFACARMTEHSVIYLDDLNFYLLTFWMRFNLLIQSTILKRHMICTS